MATSSSEAEVVSWLKAGLRRGALHGVRADQILVDSDGSYTTSPFSERLKPFGVIRIGGWRPDVVCVQERGGAERVLAFEVKAERDHEKGIVQAQRYRPGAHESYLCVPGRPASWLYQTALQVGVGLIAASAASVELVAEPAPPLPDTTELEVTRRRLVGERDFRAFGLNKPLHYAAALIAHVQGKPDQLLVNVWGISSASASLAVRGAETFGLLDRGIPTPRGFALAEIISHLGFRLDRDRSLTRRRLIDAAPAYAAVLRLIQLDLFAVRMVVRALEAAGGQVNMSELAAKAHILDPGLAGAVFGEPPAGKGWLPRPTTAFQLKAQLYDTGVLDSPLAKGADSISRGEYDPSKDIWTLGIR